MRPRILVDPHPRTLDLIFDAGTRRRFEALGELVGHDGAGPMPAEAVEAALPGVEFIVGQTDLPAARLERAGRLKAVINVEGNFLPNIDYAAAFARQIRVLAVSPAFAPSVAEAGLAMALDLARGISRSDRLFREGRERWGLEGNQDTFSLFGSVVGFIGFGDLARALRPLLVPFKVRVLAHDPWLPDDLLRAWDCEPAGLDEVFGAARLVFVLAAVTTENRGAIGRDQFARMAPGSGVVLLSRADVVDFDAFVEAVASGRIRGATDVFPEEPMPADSPVRRLDGMLLSAHRTGGTREAFRAIGRMVADDLDLMSRGLPPAACRVAQPETVGRLRSRPVARS